MMPAPSNYNEVKDRLREFFEKYPEGSLRQVSVQVYEIAGTSYLAYTAAAFRGPEDSTPGEGTAWEVVPGLTNFTRGSELQNAETSAWGRAIVAVGASNAQKGIATAEDVQWRQAEAEQRDAEEAAVGGLRSSILAAIDKLPEDQREALKAWIKAENLPAVRRMNQPQCDRVLDYLMSLPDGEAA